MKSIKLKTLWLLTTMLFLCHTGWATTVEEFFKVTSGVTIQVTNDSNYPWIVNENGELISNMHNDNGVTTISFTNTSSSAVSVSFEWKKDSEGGCDPLGHAVGNGGYTWLETNTSYQNVTLTLPASTTLSFRYQKDGSVSNGSDCGFIKNLTFTQSQSFTDDNDCVWTFYPYTNHTAEIISFSGSAEEITIPATLSFNGEEYAVTSILANAFKDNTAITSVAIPESVTSIGDYAFSGCTNLRNVTMGNNVALGTGVFTNTATLYGAMNAWGTYTDSNGSKWGYKVNQNATGATITSYSGNDFALVVPETIEHNGWSIAVEEIGGGYHDGYTWYERKVFAENKNITSVTLPATLKTIGSQAFYNCTNLISINIPDAVTSIGNSAFYGCM